MSRIFFVGDTHGAIEINKLSFQNFAEGRNLTKDDYVIICGDFGCLWSGDSEDNYWLNWLEERPFTTLFVDGNHENFPLIYSYPLKTWNGGLIHQIRPSVNHLMRGQVFTFNNETFFTMGGATSIDKVYRKEGRSWWPEEIPSCAEMATGVANLEKYNHQIDYIITHCLPNSILERIDQFYPRHDSLTNYLENMVVQEVNFKKWFCGHYHIDRTIDDKYYILYKDILELLPNNKIKVVNN